MQDTDSRIFKSGSPGESLYSYREYDTINRKADENEKGDTEDERLRMQINRIYGRFQKTVYYSSLPAQL